MYLKYVDRKIRSQEDSGAEKVKFKCIGFSVSDTSVSPLPFENMMGEHRSLSPEPLRLSVPRSRVNLKGGSISNTLMLLVGNLMVMRSVFSQAVNSNRSFGR